MSMEMDMLMVSMETQETARTVAAARICAAAAAGTRRRTVQRLRGICTAAGVGLEHERLLPSPTHREQVSQGMHARHTCLRLLQPPYRRWLRLFEFLGLGAAPPDCAC
jgi:hypothetical protein